MYKIATASRFWGALIGLAGFALFGFAVSWLGALALLLVVWGNNIELSWRTVSALRYARNMLGDCEDALRDHSAVMARFEQEKKHYENDPRTIDLASWLAARGRGPKH